MTQVTVTCPRPKVNRAFARYYQLTSRKLLRITPDMTKMLLPFVLLNLIGAVMACSSTLPNVQVLAQLNTASPPAFQAFNVPLFDDDCLYQVPAKPVMTDGNKYAK